MNAYRFVKEERTQDLASKAGVYAIHNPDSISNKKNPMYSLIDLQDKNIVVMGQPIR